MTLLPIADFPGYLASDDGNIYSMKPRRRCSKSTGIPRKLLGGYDKSGYQILRLMRGGGQVTRRTAILICETFHGPRPKGMQCCHGVGGKRDNHPENLSWGSPSKNNGDDKVRDGTSNRGGQCGRHKLTAEQVRGIRALAKSEPLKSFSGKFGVSYRHVCNIVAGKYWVWLPASEDEWMEYEAKRKI